MKKILLAFVLCFVFTLNTKAISADEIKVYDITMNVEESGLIRVNQKIKMNFAQKRHGIYANIPQMYTMNFDGVTMRYFFPVRNINVKNHMFEVDDNLDGVSIRIGDPNKYVEGIVNYEYEYEIQMRDLNYNNLQMLYFNLVGDQWENPIRKVNFRINMPKAFENKPYFYPPVNSVNEVEYTVSGNSIIGSYDGTITYGQALTIKLDLPSDYFTFPSNDQYNMIIMAVAGALSGIIMILFFRYGRERRLVKTVEFTAPDGMSSAQVGYVVDGYLHQKDITSLFIYWASKGYLTIKELDKKDKFQLIKKKDLAKDEMNFEKAIFNSLFAKSDTVNTDKIPEEYSQVILGANSDYKSYFINKKTPIFEKRSKFIQAITFILSSILIASNLAVNFNLFFGSFGIGIVVFVVSLIAYILSSLLIIASLRNRKVKTKATNLGLTIAAVVVLLVYCLLYLVAAEFIGANIIVQCGVLILSYISLFFIAFMDKRTEQGNRWLGQLLGLKDFIKHAEKQKLEMLVEENPQYFYDVLPYAYVLNVSDKWIKKFENIKIEQPEWFQTSSPVTTYIFLASLNRSMNTINASMSAIPKAEGGSGGLSSGGFGGGGFSGGGFGGGGGGSW